jgi:hypothetical protein
MAGDRGSDDPFGGVREPPSHAGSRYVFRNVRVAVRNGGVLPVVAERMMRDADWRNLGETLASL